MKENRLPLSVQGGRVTRYLFVDKPSDIVPFKGSFPLVEKYKAEEVYDLLHKYDYLEECPEWFQTVILKAQKIFLIDTGFAAYLEDCGISNEFNKFSAAEKSTLLVRYMNKECLSLSRLKID